VTALAVCAAALVAAVLALSLRGASPVFAVLVSFAGGLLLLLPALGAAAPLVSAVEDLAAQAALRGEHAAALFKALGIALCTQFTSDACRQAGEEGIAKKAELCGRVLIVTAGLPVFEEVLRLAQAVFDIL